MKRYFIWLIVIIASYSFYMLLTTKAIKLDKIYIINLERSKDRYLHMQDQLNAMKLPAEIVRFSAFDGMNIELVNKTTGERIKGSEFASNIKLLKGDFQVICSKAWPGDLETLKLNMIHFSKRFAGELGCACSHRKIWHDIISNEDQNALIFEDDIFLAPYFDQYLQFALKFAAKNSELLYLAITGGTWTYKTLSKLEYQALNAKDKITYFIQDQFNRYAKNIFFKQVIRQPGTASAYILSKRGAEKLIEAPSIQLHGERKIINNGILTNADVADGILDDAVTRKILNAYVIKPLIAKQKFEVIASNISNKP